MSASQAAVSWQGDGNILEERKDQIVFAHWGIAPLGSVCSVPSQQPWSQDVMRRVQSL